MEKVFDIRHIFEPVLVIACLISLVCYAIYFFWFRKELKSSTEILKRKFGKKGSKEAVFAKTQQIVNNPIKRFVYFWADLFGVLFAVVFIRSFIAEPFVIPSASMYPGLIEGDIVLVNKNIFGIRLPVLGNKITGGTPEAGDVTVFKYPKDENVNYIKRAIAVGGDKIEYDNRTMKINGKAIALSPIPSSDTKHNIFEEVINGKPHQIQYSTNQRAQYDKTNVTIPNNHYLMLGDNRDNSQDGRYFGYLEDDKVIGKATYIIFNWRCLKGEDVCDRFLRRIK